MASRLDYTASEDDIVLVQGIARDTIHGTWGAVTKLSHCGNKLATALGTHVRLHILSRGQSMFKLKIKTIAVSLAVAAVTAAVPARAQHEITGAGATFPNPI